MTVTKTGGAWDPADRHVSFLAGSPSDLAKGAANHPWLLTAVNEISDDDVAMIEGWCRAGKHVLIDSGVYNLASTHARNHDISHDQALNLAPDQIDGFRALFDRYVDLLRHLGDQVWGYIEIDQGGRDNKIKTRSTLQQLGFTPIPVYHPFGDGWEYFDQLAQGYDRMCFGNVVQASHIERNKLLATAYTRRQAYPDLWIHMLGMTANEFLNAYPVDSCDSSTWLAHVRWPAGVKFKSALKGVSPMPLNMRYVVGAPAYDGAHHDRGRLLGSYEAQFNDRCWHGLHDEYRDQLGVS